MWFNPYRHHKQRRIPTRSHEDAPPLSSLSALSSKTIRTVLGSADNEESVPTAELASSVTSAGGPDTTPPTLEIVSPTMQDWSAYPRVVLNYADGGSGINSSSLRVSFNRVLGNPAAGGRTAGNDITDLFFRKDGHGYIAALRS